MSSKKDKNDDKDKISKEIDSQKNKNQKARELDKTVQQVIKQIPIEYRDKNFSHIARVARALKKLNAGKTTGSQDDMQELTTNYEKLNNTISEIVNGMCNWYMY